MAVGVRDAPEVNTPDRHPRPATRARKKHRERLAQEESQRNRDLLQSVRDEDSASRCKLEPEGVRLVCEKVVAECDWEEWAVDDSLILQSCPSRRVSGVSKNQQV